MEYVNKSNVERLLEVLKEGGLPFTEELTGLGHYNTGLGQMSYGDSTVGMPVADLAMLTLQKGVNSPDGPHEGAETYQRMFFVGAVENENHLIVADFSEDNGEKISQAARLPLDDILGYASLVRKE
ncbi:hypothetical protein HOA92_06920 [archaeon]|jgi:hypothetical protein|nr:hypothetical protein [archaeon]MBT6762744.1 hypothetical protein [archaeon]